MSEYLLYPRAKRELEDIWFSTKERWGEQQANNYIYELDARIQKAAVKQIPWRKLPGQVHLTGTNIFQIHYKRRYIFFKELKNGKIGVMTVLHDAMDIPHRLRSALKKMDGL